jgi:hypothetical protein
MGRKNRRSGSIQTKRRSDGSRGRAPSTPPPALNALVIPEGRCHLRHSKLQFTEITVHKALRQAQAKRDRLGQAHHEERVYECKKTEGGCGFWHLTSRTTWTPRRTTT